MNVRGVMGWSRQQMWGGREWFVAFPAMAMVGLSGGFHLPANWAFFGLDTAGAIFNYNRAFWRLGSWQFGLQVGCCTCRWRGGWLWG